MDSGQWTEDRGQWTVDSRQWYWVSLASFVLAMLGKGSVAVLPVLLLGISWWLRHLTWRDFVRVRAIFSDCHGVNWCKHMVPNTRHWTDPKHRFYRAVAGVGTVVWFYLYKAILPLNLSFVYPQWQIQVDNLLWWLPVSAALALTAVLWWCRKRWSRPLLFAWGFFCVVLVPVMGLKDVYFMTYSLVADHYQHIAIIAVIAMGAASWSLWRRSGWVGRIVQLTLSPSPRWGLSHL